MQQQFGENAEAIVTFHDIQLLAGNAYTLSIVLHATDESQKSIDFDEDEIVTEPETPELLIFATSTDVADIQVNWANMNASVHAGKTVIFTQVSLCDSLNQKIKKVFFYSIDPSNEILCLSPCELSVFSPTKQLSVLPAVSYQLTYHAQFSYTRPSDSSTHTVTGHSRLARYLGDVNNLAGIQDSVSSL